MIRFLRIFWEWIKRNHQPLSALSAVAAMLTVVVSFVSLIKSADQFSNQLDAQKRATSVNIVSDFISTIGKSLVGDKQIHGNDRFERLVATRTRLLVRSIEYPDLTNQLIYFLATNDLGKLFEMGAPGEPKHYISLSNINLQGSNIRDIELSSVELFCANIKNAYFSNVKFDGGAIFHNADLSGSNLINTRFLNAHFLWTNLMNLSIELTAKDLDVFNGAKILFSNLKGLTIAKVKSSNKKTVDENEELALMLSKAETLYGSQLDDDVDKFLKKEYPERYDELFKDPNPDSSGEKYVSSNWLDRWKTERHNRCSQD